MNTPPAGPEVVVLSRSDAEDFVCDKPWACISICCPGDEPASLSEEQRVSRIDFVFLDADGLPKADAELFSDEELFSWAHAGAIWDFVLGIWDEVDVLLIHCLMGQSRSPAVAAAVEKVLRGDDQHWFDRKTPNRLVYRLLIETAADRGLIG